MFNLTATQRNATQRNATQRNLTLYNKSPLFATALVALLGGVLGFSSIASAMEFQLYGSIRGGLVQTNTDDVEKATVADSDGNITRPDLAGMVEIRPAEEVDVDDNGTLGEDTVEGEDVAAKNEPVTTSEEGRDVLELGNLSDPAFSRFGVKGSEDLGNGLSAGFQFERGMGADLNLRHENVWIGGGWGKFTIGNQSNPYRNAANWDQSWYIGGNNRYDDGGTRNNGIRYDSAALGPVRFSLMASADSTSGAKKVSTIYVNDVNARCSYRGCAAIAASDNNFDGDMVDAGEIEVDQVDRDNTKVIGVTHAAVDDEDGIDALIATIHYDIGDIATINLGYQTNEQEGQNAGESYDNAVISANGSAGPFTWYVAYEENSDNYNEPTVNLDVDGDDTDVAATTAGAKYVAQRYVAQDAETVGVFLALSVSESDLLYMEYEDSSVDGTDQYLEGLDKESILLGYSHKFGPHTAFVAEYLTVDTESDYTADSSTLLATLKVDF